jgi:hypothetical protein
VEERTDVSAEDFLRKTMRCTATQREREMSGTAEFFLTLQTRKMLSYSVSRFGIEENMYCGRPQRERERGIGTSTKWQHVEIREKGVGEVRGRWRR